MLASGRDRQFNGLGSKGAMRDHNATMLIITGRDIMIAGKSVIRKGLWWKKRELVNKESNK